MSIVHGNHMKKKVQKKSNFIYAYFDKGAEFLAQTDDGKIMRMLIREGTMCKIEEVKVKEVTK
jgi:hypothetical protein